MKYLVKMKSDVHGEYEMSVETQTDTDALAACGRITGDEPLSAEPYPYTLFKLGPEATEFVRSSVRHHIEMLVDDPHGFGEPIPELIASTRLIAAQLGVDFDGVVAEFGSPSEIARLESLEH